MQQRCRACDRKLFDTEIMQVQEDGTPEDLCNICKAHAYDEGEYHDTVDYAHSDITNGVVLPCKVEY